MRDPVQFQSNSSKHQEPRLCGCQACHFGCNEMGVMVFGSVELVFVVLRGPVRSTKETYDTFCIPAGQWPTQIMGLFFIHLPAARRRCWRLSLPPPQNIRSCTLADSFVESSTEPRTHRYDRKFAQLLYPTSFKFLKIP
jgi:hypothetical protein